MSHAEALLLVHDQQAQVSEPDVLGKHAMGADEDVHLAGGHPLQNGLLFPGSAESAQHLDGDGKCGKALPETQVVLVDQDGRGSQDRRLLAVEGRLEGRPHGHFGLAEAHVPTEQPVHGAAQLHVPVQVPNSVSLIRRLGELEGILELPMPVAVGGKAVSRRDPSSGIEIEQLLSHVPDGLPGAGLGSLPAHSSQLVERRAGAVAAAVLLNQIQPLQGHVKAGFVEILQDHELLLHSIAVDLLQTPVAADTVVHVHQVVSRPQLAEVRNKGSASGLGRCRMGEELHFVEDVLVPEDTDPGGGLAESFQDVADHDGNPVAGPIAFPVPVVEIGSDRKIVFPQHFPQALGPSQGGLGEQQSKAGLQPLAQVPGQAGDVAVVLSDGRRLTVQMDWGRGGSRLRS